MFTLRHFLVHGIVSPYYVCNARIGAWDALNNHMIYDFIYKLINLVLPQRRLSCVCVCVLFKMPSIYNDKHKESGGMIPSDLIFMYGDCI